MKHSIRIEQVRLGMHIVAFEGSWFRHPFWRARFLLKDAADLEAIRGCGLDTLIIDDALGLGPVDEPAAPASVVAEAVANPVAVPQALAPIQRVSTPDEEQRAAEIVRHSKRAVTRMFGEARLGHAVRPSDVEPLVDDIAESVARDGAALIKVTRLKKKNEYTYLHSVAVCALMINLARQMGLGEGVVRELGMAGLLHDIGKMSVPDKVLDKPGALDDREMTLIRKHPQMGHDLLQKTAELSPIALDVCLHHHERLDGTGYPFGLSGEQLSLYARMGAVCDVYDAVTSRRPYKEPWSPAEALAKMLTWDGHFDRQVLHAFIRSIGIFPVGALVRLRSNRLGLVIGANNRAPTLPLVRAFYTAIDEEFMPLETFTCSDTLKGDGIVGLEAADRWFGTRWPIVQSFILDNRMPPATLGQLHGEEGPAGGGSMAVVTPRLIGVRN